MNEIAERGIGLQLGVIGRWLVGVAFLLMALAKMYAFGDSGLYVSNAFERYLVLTTPLEPGLLAVSAARGLIALELVLGLALLVGGAARETAWLTIFLLGAFGVFLLTQLGAEDCGCFGEHLQLTPEVSILKNVLMGLFLVPTICWPDETKLRRKSLFVMMLASGLAVTLGMPTPDAALPAQENPREELELRAFLSMDCEHCQEVALMLTALAADLAPAAVRFYLNGTEEQLAEFHDLTGSFEVPYYMMTEAAFFEHIHGAPPRIVLARGENELAEWDHETLSDAALYEAIRTHAEQQ